MCKPGTYKFKYRQSSDWFDNNGNSLRICASRSLGTSSNASRPVGEGGNCGHTGEKRSASRVLFHAEGVTGGIYLMYGIIISKG